MSRNINTYFIVLYLSILAFIGKGVMYVLIGSYIPMILSLLVLGVFLISRKRNKLLLISIKFWAIILIIWSLLRILIGSLNFFIKPLTENHLHQQLGIRGTIISLIFLGTGIYLLRKRHSENKN